MQQAGLFELHGLIAGVDEAGRGPLAGPVVAAAVILSPERPIDGLADSKKLSPARRERLADRIRRDSMAWSVGWSDPAEIDDVNILAATMLAMRRAVERLPVRPKHVLVDGNCCPRLPCTVDAIVGGDATVPAISAASILAKVSRDREMCELDVRYPGYGLAQHKGYPSKAHLAALQALGASPVHRRSYAPVRRLLDARGEAS